VNLAGPLIPFGNETFQGKQDGSIAKLNVAAVQNAEGNDIGFSVSASSAAKKTVGCENGFAKKVSPAGLLQRGFLITGATDACQCLCAVAA
jgi:hypothetical protein